MYRKLLPLLSLALLTSAAFAQDADALLSKLSERAKNYGTIDASYSSQLVDLKNNFTEDMSGNILVDGGSFKLDLGDYLIISDGTTVWTYDTESNECYLDDADMLIDEGMDPSKIFTIWEDDFKTEWKGTVELDGRECAHINLYPLSGDKPYHTLQLLIDETKLEIVRLTVKGREGNETEYNIERFETGVNLPESTFQFIEVDYPGVELIDNRF
jgi:outer membrane lipoprotein carrier protein